MKIFIKLHYKIINFPFFSFTIIFYFFNQSFCKVFKTNSFTWLKNKNFIILFIFYLYICANSFFNYYISPPIGYDGITRSLLFQKHIAVLFMCIVKTTMAYNCLIEKGREKLKLHVFHADKILQASAIGCAEFAITSSAYVLYRYEGMPKNLARFGVDALSIEELLAL